MTFVKSENTVVPASRSQVELERVLRRYGATGFGVSSDYELGVVRVFFSVPDGPEADATSVPVRLEVNVNAVSKALGHGKPRASWDKTWKKPTASEREKAERVAWRHLVLWVDAALSAASAGVQKVSEAFLAHTLVRGEDGQVLRVVEQMDKAAGGNWRALLPSGNAS